MGDFSKPEKTRLIMSFVAGFIVGVFVWHAFNSAVSQPLKSEQPNPIQFDELKPTMGQ